MNKNKNTKPIRQMVTTAGGRTLTRPVDLSCARRMEALMPALLKMNEVERLSSEDMGPRVGLTPQTIRSWFKMWGVKIHNFKKWTRVDRTGWETTIPALRKSGMSIVQIAKRVGSEPTSVCRWLCNNGMVTIERSAR